MAASAATLRLLLRRRASARGPPSLARLHPLIPGPFSTPFSLPLPAASSAGLLDVRRALASSAPAPYLLRHYSSKSSEGSAPWRPTGGVGKGAPSQKQVIQHCSIITYLETWLHKRRVLNRLKDLLKRSEMLMGALEMLDKASNLLYDWWDERTLAMFENELDNTWEAFAAYEKGLDDFAKAVDSFKGLPVDILEECQAFCKQTKDTIKCSRQYLEKISSKFEDLKMVRKLIVAELSSPFETLKKQLTIIAVGLGTCLLLTLVIVRSYLT